MRRTVTTALMYTLLQTVPLFASPPPPPTADPVTAHEQEVETLAALNQDVLTQYGQGKYEQAMESARNALDLSKKIYGPRHYKVATSLNNLGLLHQKMAGYGEAEQLYKQALAIDENYFPADHPNISRDLSNLATLYTTTNRHEEAEKLLTRALHTNSKLLAGDLSRMAETNNNLAHLYSSSGRDTEAEPLYKRALGINRKLYKTDHPKIAAGLGNLAELYKNMGRYGDAEPLYKQVLEIRRKLDPEHPDLGIALNNLGNFLQITGHYTEAESLLLEGLALYEKAFSPPHPAIAGALTNLAELYTTLSRYAEAAPLYERALRMDIDLFGEDSPDVATDLNNLAGFHLDTGHYSKAETLFRRALAIRQQTDPDGPRMADAMNNLAELYRTTGRYGLAEPLYRQAIALSSRALGPEHPDTAVWINNLAVLYDNTGRYAEAEPLYRQVLTIREQVLPADHPDIAITTGNLALLCKVTGRFQESEVLCKQALAMHERFFGPEHPAVAGDLNTLALLYNATGRRAEAEPLYKRALAINEKILGPNHPKLARELNNLAALYTETDRLSQAEQLYTRALKIAASAHTPDLLWNTQANLGRLEFQQGRESAAASHLEAALDTIEQMRTGVAEKQARTAFMQDKFVVYDELITLLLKLHKDHPDKGYDRRAFEIFERKQGRLFLEEMGQSGARHFAGVPDAVREEELRIEAQTASLAQTLLKEQSRPMDQRNQEKIRNLAALLAGLEQDRARLQQRIQTEFPDYHALKYPRPADLKGLQENVLEPGEALLVYNVMEHMSCVWFIDAQGLVVLPLPAGATDLTDRIKAFNSLPHQVGTAVETGQSKAAIASRARRTRRTLQRTGRALFDLLIPEQLRQRLNSAESLYIVPTGPLYDLPFEALILPAPDNGRKTHYLIEQHTVSYLSSASLLKVLRQTDHPTETTPRAPLLAFANPTYSAISAAGHKTETNSTSPSTSLRTRAYSDLFGGGFSELPDSEQEVRQILNLLAAASDTDGLHLREDASRSTVLALNTAENLDDYRYVVFSCHGLLPGESDRLIQPALVLSNPDPVTGRDGFLTMGDVFGLRFNADLITLSACNTGRGRKQKGEGVVGMTRAFMYAGTPAVSVTLWAVESGSAATLSTGLYRELKKGKGRAEALRTIKLEMIRGKHGELYRHPYFWAPVVLFGEGEPSEPPLSAGLTAGPGAGHPIGPK